MKVTRQQLDSLGDITRSILYPLIPIFGIACVWVVGIASSLDSKINRELGPYAHKNLPLIHKPAPEEPAVVSIDAHE